MASHLFVRPRHLDWGATDDEVDRELPGDELVPAPSSETTRAVTVEAPSDGVWPWVVQLGQGRGGSYSYSWLENPVSADIHNVDRSAPEFQRLAERGLVWVAKGAHRPRSPTTPMEDETVDSWRTVLLRVPDVGAGALHLEPIDDGATRFVVRGRTPQQSLLGRVVRYLAYGLPHFVMERE